MTTTENDTQTESDTIKGIDLLEMTTIENNSNVMKPQINGIYLFEMTTIENYHIILISDDC